MKEEPKQQQRYQKDDQHAEEEKLPVGQEPSDGAKGSLVVTARIPLRVPSLIASLITGFDALPASDFYPAVVSVTVSFHVLRGVRPPRTLDEPSLMGLLMDEAHKRENADDGDDKQTSLIHAENPVQVFEASGN
ncbi:hypothetical protein HAHE_24990 [Haloferula helveola]|uniref:Uncharacterized protein n=1 Tax=Haloferula helveola TaxID=490095 RepID=A0ABN6H4N5_9BACT|nr:hypothetical protein HAHE_24990 [Haloferula helveola]